MKMGQRCSRATVLISLMLLLCPGCCRASATGPLETGSARRWEDRSTSAAHDAERVKGEATALHRAGEYEAAAREFARAAQFVEGSRDSASQSMLRAIRLSLAASQLKCGDMAGAEATCSQLLRTSGLPRPLRQKASYRRALARRHQALEAASAMQATSPDKELYRSLARKAYRDAYIATRLAQDEAADGIVGGDSKALALLEATEGQLEEADKEAAKAKADEYLESLAKTSTSVSTAGSGDGIGGGLFDLLSSAPGGVPGNLGAFSGVGSENRGAGGMPGLMDLVGAGAGGSGGMGSILSTIMGGAGGAVDGKSAGAGVDKKQVLKTAKKMGKVVKRQLRNPSTQQLVCSLLKRAEPETLRSMADAAGITVGEGMISRVSSYLKEADGKTLEGWIAGSEIVAGVYRRLSQLSVVWSRGLALAGLWLVWVWIKACFVPVVTKGVRG